MPQLTKVYLDTCSLFRPWDDRRQLKIAMEAEAIQAVTGLFEAGQIELLSSQVLRYEISLNPDIERRAYGEALLAKAAIDIKMNDEIDLHAKDLERLGIKTIDALHLSSSIYGKSDFFCSSDLRFLKRARQAKTYLTKVVTPLELIEYL